METPAIHILIVDDDENARRTLHKIFRLKGYQVDESDTGGRAIQAVAERFYHVVALDVRLPDASGLDVLKAIRDISEDTVVIMMTGYASLDSSVEAMNKGAYSYITKPVNMDHALLIIEKALEKQRLSLENKRLLTELRDANAKLLEYDKRKSAFVANVSHEFNNPLTVIQQSLSLILDGIVGEIDEKQKEILTMARVHIERLIRLVHDLLDLSKIEAGKMELKRDQFRMASLVREILSTYEWEFSKKDISLIEDVPQDMGLVLADMDKISEVVINLLSNALKHTPPKGEITVRLRETESDVSITISDTGPGIPREYLESIFDKFERITAERAEGTGLGLSIAKEIVELHKGRIWVESEVGRGSEFTFLLPKDRT